MIKPFHLLVRVKKLTERLGYELVSVEAFHLLIYSSHVVWGFAV